MNNNEELYAVVERQCFWTKDINAGTRVLRHKSAEVEIAKVRVLLNYDFTNHILNTFCF